jgi:hypothetical protein
MPLPKRSERACRLRRGYGARPTAALGWLLALWSAHCAFPNYVALPEATGATAGGGSDATGGTTTSAGVPSGASTSLGGGVLAEGGEGGAGGAVGEGGAAGLGEGGSGECPGEQWPVNLCPSTCLQRYPDHCYDDETNDAQGEVGRNCGGPCQGCSVAACEQSSDCLSGVCAAGAAGMGCASPLTVSIDPRERNSNVARTAWWLTLLNEELAGQTFLLEDLELRYYFDRNAVVEPIVVAATQADLYPANAESRELQGTSWLVERIEDSPDAPYNAYVAIRFEDSGQFSPGDRIETRQQVATGDPASSFFEQLADYSFPGVPSANWLRVTVFYRGKLLWGLEPRSVNPRACFARAVNLNGPSLTNVNGQRWQSAADAGVSTTGSPSSHDDVLYPVTGAGLTTALRTTTRLLAGQSLELPTDNAEYLVHLYAVSTPNGGTLGELTLQGQSFTNSTRFNAQVVEGGYAWSRLGPYRVEVTTGSLDLAVTSGSIHFAGIELWYPQ